MPDDTVATPVRILIVDHSETFVTSVAAWIAARPGVVLAGTARSGPEGLDAVERLDPDLVLADVALPELDGFRFVRRIKRRARAPWAVVTTFLPCTVAREAAHDAGADGFLAKDDFAGSFELLLDELLARPRRRNGRFTTLRRSIPRGSRTEPTR